MRARENVELSSKERRRDMERKLTVSYRVAYRSFQLRSCVYCGLVESGRPLTRRITHLSSRASRRCPDFFPAPCRAPDAGPAVDRWRDSWLVTSHQRVGRYGTQRRSRLLDPTHFLNDPTKPNPWINPTHVHL